MDWNPYMSEIMSDGKGGTKVSVEITFEEEEMQWFEISAVANTSMVNKFISET